MLDHAERFVPTRPRRSRATRSGSPAHPRRRGTRRPRVPTMPPPTTTTSGSGAEALTSVGCGRGRRWPRPAQHILSPAAARPASPGRRPRDHHGNRPPIGRRSGVRLDRGSLPVHRLGREAVVRGGPRPRRRDGLRVHRDRGRRPVPAPHLRIGELLADRRKRRAFADAFASRGLRIAALNCSAWPLHPVHGHGPGGAHPRHDPAGRRARRRQDRDRCRAARATGPARPRSTGSGTRGRPTRSPCWSGSGPKRSRSGRRWPPSPSDTG